MYMWTVCSVTCGTQCVNWISTNWCFILPLHVCVQSFATDSCKLEADYTYDFNYYIQCVCRLSLFTPTSPVSLVILSVMLVVGMLDARPAPLTATTTPSSTVTVEEGEGSTTLSLSPFEC